MKHQPHTFAFVEANWLTADVRALVRASDQDRPVVDPPDSVMVQDASRPILYDCKGRALYRPVGFTRSR